MSNRARALGACCLWAAAAASPAIAQPRATQSARIAAPAPTVAAHRVSSPMTIDGTLDEAVYASTPAIGGFVQQEPNEFQPATEKTEAWIFFDDRNIYVSARCFESEPARRVANEMRRDTNQLRQNDTFAVLFDTFHDKRNGYLFYANSIGGFADSQITDEGPPNVDWNTVWSVRTKDFDGGWTIEMAIPFKSLRYAPGREQTWGLNLRRVVRWKNEWSYLAQVPRALTTFRGMLKVSSAGTLTGLEAPGGTRTIEIKPYALGSVSTDRTASPPLSSDGDYNVGGDLKYGITQNLTADLTVNTDFAQVEVDEQQVNLTRFNLFFPEKRDFFLEGAGTFAFAGRASAGLAAGSGDTPYLFFSRRIGLDGGREVPLQIGGRVTGKAGKFTVGALNVQTGDEAAVDVESANHTVLRAKRDILGRSYVGGMFTHRTATPGRVGANEGFGVDSSFGFYQNVRVDGYVAATKSEGRDGDDLSYRGFFDYNADRYGFQAERLEVQPNFLPELGFLRRTDFRRNFGLLRFSPRPRNVPHLRKVTMQASLNYTTNTENRLDTREQVGQFQTEFTNSDVAARHLYRHHGSPGATVRHRSGYPNPGRRLRVSHHAAVVHRRPAAKAVRRHRLRDRHVLQRHPPVAGAQHRARGVDAAVFRGAKLLGQLGRSAGGLVHRQRRAGPHHVHRHPSHVRERHRPVQLDEHIRRQQRALPMGVSARERDLRGVYRRLQHRDDAKRGPAAQPRAGREAEPAVQAVGELTLGS